MIQCSFEETVDLPDGRFRTSMCFHRAEIMIISDPCYGLCYACADRKLKTENDRLLELSHYGCHDQTAISLIHKAKVNKEQAVG